MDGWPVGTICAIYGLQSEAGQQLNGCSAEVMAFDDDSGRLVLRLEPNDPPSRFKKVKPEHVRKHHVDSTPHASSVDTFCIGSVVMFHGLSGERGQKLNGYVGEVMAVDQGKLTVRLNPDDSEALWKRVASAKVQVFKGCEYCGAQSPLFNLPAGRVCKCCTDKLDWWFKFVGSNVEFGYVTGREAAFRRFSCCDSPEEEYCSVCHIGTAGGRGAHQPVISPHTKKAVCCKNRGFRRCTVNLTYIATEPEAMNKFQKYAAIYTHGVGRWDCTSSPVDGIITYSVGSCIAVCITDSIEAPSRCSLIHAPQVLAWEQAVRNECLWVSQSPKVTGVVKVVVIKGMSTWRYQDEPTAETELNWELTDTFLPDIHKELPTGVELLLVHEALWCGVVASGRDGLIAPTLPLTPEYGKFAQELPVEEIARRHMAMADISNRPRQNGKKVKSGLDLQYDGKSHVKPTDNDLIREMKKRAKTPVDLLPNLPMISKFTGPNGTQTRMKLQIQEMQGGAPDCKQQ